MVAFRQIDQTTPAGALSSVSEPVRTPLPARPSILVIEDDPLVQMVIEAALESMGHFEVWSATDGVTGLHMIEALRPDVVFLDLMIPGKNGFSVLEALQLKGAAVDGIRVVVTSGLMGQVTEDRLAELGVTEILAKPFRLADLKAVMSATSPAKRAA